jgi:hypothetical protein
MMNFWAFEANIISNWIQNRIPNADPGDKSNTDPDAKHLPELRFYTYQLQLFFSFLSRGLYSKGSAGPSPLSALCWNARTRIRYKAWVKNACLAPKQQRWAGKMLRRSSINSHINTFSINTLKIE